MQESLRYIRFVRMGDTVSLSTALNWEIRLISWRKTNLGIKEFQDNKVFTTAPFLF